jgi:hypothetical protein
MNFLALIFTLLLSICAFAAGPDTSRLQLLLDVDRFEAYTQAWSATMRGRDKAAIADAIQRLTPEDFLSMNLDPAKLADAKNYDALILQILKKRNPELKATAAQVEWGYNFFKNKLNEGYRLETTRLPAPTVGVPQTADASLLPPTSNGTHAPLKPDEVLLDVGGYASDRTTRAAFWEAAESGRQVELHVGSPGDFRRTLALRGATVVGEIKAKARNYNPIYLVQYPGESTYRYAVTSIGGADRTLHFQMQTALLRLRGANGAVANPPPITIVGDPIAHLADETTDLTRILREAPHADRVVIGQKGAFERTFGSMAKIRSLVTQYEQDPAKLAKILSEKEMKLVEKAAKAGDNVTELVMKYASDIDKLYEKATPLLTRSNLLVQNSTVFTFDRGSYTVSDYVMMGRDGKPQRWRIFSNVWGDEVLPIARALKATEHNRIVYIGTAGTFQGTDIKVGDLVRPASATTPAGEVLPLRHDPAIKPEGLREVASVTTVQSPFEETHDWLRNASRANQMVEVETTHLAGVFTDPKDRVTVLLLASDVVGSEGETLAAATSSSRRRAQIAALSSVLDEAGVATPGVVPETAVDKIARWISEIVPTRDPASAAQLYREAHGRGLSTRAQVQAMIKSVKSFTTAKLETVLIGAQTRMQRLAEVLRIAKVTPELGLASSMFDGRFNPATGGVQLNLRVSANNQARVSEVIQDMMKDDKNFRKFLDVRVTTTLPEGFVTLGKLGEAAPEFKMIYSHGVLRYAGLALTETANGGMKFVRLASATSETVNVVQISSKGVCTPNSIARVLDGLLR